jgi:hypothetical protein
LIYVNDKIAKKAIQKMKKFHDSLESIYSNNGMGFLDDLGRRNILMSRPQEVFFCEEIKNSFPSAISDGRTGQPDILIPEIKKELECKITSKRKGGSWSFQADYATLERKGSCDFLYVCCDKDFENFAVFHFDNLTVSDFKIPAPGSRGKSRLILRNCIDRCSSLIGGLEERNKSFIQKALVKLNDSKTEIEKSKAKKSIDFWEKSPKSYSIILESV